MSDEEDIGLYNPAYRTDSFTRTPERIRQLRRQSIVSILKREELTPIKSPSNPNFNVSPKMSTRKLSRSNTLPRLVSQRSDLGKGTPLEDANILPMEPEKVEKLRRWISGLVIGKSTCNSRSFALILLESTVDFDLDYGPKIATVYPELTLDPTEAENIAFSSFPDTTQTASGSYIHSFRIRHQFKAVADAISSAPHVDGFIYGYSHFTQRRDTSSKRGYQQRSLVILSQHPYPALFYTLLSYLGQAFLSHGGPMLEAACHNIANWSDPVPGTTLELGFLGYVFSAELPKSVDERQSTIGDRTHAHTTPESHILVSLAPQDPPVIEAFEACLPQLWSIWECLLLCEPILVFGSSAAITSQIIWWLRDLLRPIPFAGDHRPFFTIHDAEHTVLVNPRPPQAGLLLGVTNPIFARACRHWPHVLSLGPPHKKTKSHTHTVDTSVGPQPGWNTKSHKRYISRDQLLLKRTEEACKGSNAEKMQASEAIREHFASRTTAFLVPLQRYLNTLIPTFADRSAPPTPIPSSANFHGSSGSLHSDGPSQHSQPHLRLKTFNEGAFFASLKANGSPLPFKSSAKRREFYERWLRTSAFGMWIAAQEEVVNNVLAQDVPLLATRVGASVGVPQ